MAPLLVEFMWLNMARTVRGSPRTRVLGLSCVCLEYSFSTAWGEGYFSLNSINEPIKNYLFSLTVVY